MALGDQRQKKIIMKNMLREAHSSNSKCQLWVMKGENERMGLSLLGYDG